MYQPLVCSRLRVGWAARSDCTSSSKDRGRMMCRRVILLLPRDLAMEKRDKTEEAEILRAHLLQLLASQSASHFTDASFPLAAVIVVSFWLLAGVEAT